MNQSFNLNQSYTPIKIIIMAQFHSQNKINHQNAKHQIYETHAHQKQLASLTWQNSLTDPNNSKNSKLPPITQDVLSTHRNITKTIRTYCYDHWSI